MSEAEGAFLTGAQQGFARAAFELAGAFSLGWSIGGWLYNDSVAVQDTSINAMATFLEDIHGMGWFENSYLSGYWKWYYYDPNY